MVTLQPNNNVEPFIHLRKGRTNEYKVSHTTTELWQLQPINRLQHILVLFQATIIIFLFITTQTLSSVS